MKSLGNFILVTLCLLFLWGACHDREPSTPDHERARYRQTSQTLVLGEEIGLDSFFSMFSVDESITDSLIGTPELDSLSPNPLNKQAFSAKAVSTTTAIETKHEPRRVAPHVLRKAELARKPPVRVPLTGTSGGLSFR